MERQQEIEMRILEPVARKMLEEFIIPKFKEIAEEKPSYILHIDFEFNIDTWFYRTNIDDITDRNISPYCFKVVRVAINLAKEYNIKAWKCDDGSGGTYITFQKWR